MCSTQLVEYIVWYRIVTEQVFFSNDNRIGYVWAYKLKDRIVGTYAQLKRCLSVDSFSGLYVNNKFCRHGCFMFNVDNMMHIFQKIEDPISFNIYNF